MLTAQERLDFIVQRVEESGTIRVSDLSQELDCSEVTIRNDIRKLDQQGYLRKTHGGAEVRRDGLSIPFEQGEYFWNREEKARIAERAYQYINSRDSIIIDDSTTGYYLAKIIRRAPEKRIIVVTNSILVAAELAPAQHVELFVVSGHVVGNPPAALDTFTIEAFKQFNVTRAFIGCNGIHFQNGLASLGATQRDVKKAIVDAANEVYVLADHTKFNGSCLFSICPLSDVTRIITDDKVKPDQVAMARKMNIVMDTV